MPRVSVVIPAYNAEAYLAEAVESVLAQTFRDLEVIVVNDGSTDGTAGVIGAYGDHIRTVDQTNQGPVTARNRGIAEGDSEFVAFLDSDDTWQAEKLRLQVACADEAGPELGLVHSDWTLVDEQGRPIEAFRRRGVAGRALGYLILYNHVNTSTALVRRECFERVGAFDRELVACEDWNLWLRIAARYRLGHVAHALCNTRAHRDSLSHRADTMCRDQIRALELAFEDPEIARQVGHLRPRAYARAHLNCAVGYFRAGEMAECRRHLARAQRLNPAIVSETAFVSTLAKSLLGRGVAERLRAVKRALARLRS